MVQGMFGPVRECNNSQPDYSQVSPGTTYHQFSQASLQQTSALLPTSPAAAAIGVYWGARRGASAAEPNWAPSRGPAGGRRQLQCRHARRPAQPRSPGSGEGRATLLPSGAAPLPTPAAPRPGPAERPRQRGAVSRDGGPVLRGNPPPALGDEGAGVGGHGGYAA